MYVYCCECGCGGLCASVPEEFGDVSGVAGKVVEYDCMA